MELAGKSKVLWVAALCAAFVLVSSLGAAQRWVTVTDSNPGEAPELSVLSSDDTRTVIEVSLPGFCAQERFRNASSKRRNGSLI